jgi:surface protein
MKKLLLLIITMQITLFAAPYIPINSGDVVEDHVDYLEKKYYELELGKTQTADIQLTDLNADIDLYVAINRRAAIRDNDCYSSNGDTTYEKCVLTSTAPEGKENSIIILVYGFKASNYKLKISTREGGESIKEISDTPLSGHLKQGESEQYKFLAKKGETYTTTLFALSDDADLRVRVGRKAGLHSFDCKSTNGGTKTDECSVTLTKDDTVYVHLYGYKSANYQINVLQKNIQEAPITLAELKEMILHNEDVSNVNTSQITDTSGLFTRKPNFNDDISSWDVSNVTNMSYMFEAATSFNAPIGNWDVSNVSNMENMFQGATYFNQSLENWNVSNVSNMHGMFDSAQNFNQPIGAWDVSNVTDMSYMFDRAYAFNQNIENWNVSNVSSMKRMFRVAQNFNQPLAKWDVSNVTNTHSMFGRASSFNKSIEKWNVANVTDMGYMFDNTKNFNQPVENWDVSSVTDMINMFNNATSFTNHDLSKWNVVKTEKYSDFLTNAGENNIEPLWILENQVDEIDEDYKK